MKETVLAAAVVRWLEEESWTVYQEVEYEGRIADIVAVRGPVVWVIESKTCRSGTLIIQARSWTGHANKVSVAVPRRRRAADPQQWDLILHRSGIGELTVDESGDVQIVRSPVHFTMTDLGIRSVLKEEHKDFAKAGNSEGKRYTPFQHTKQMLIEAVDEHPGIALRDFVDNFHHHYSTNKVAVASLRDCLNAGNIKGLVYRSGKVYRADFNRHSMRPKE